MQAEDRMARDTKLGEVKRELVENRLACLGVARVLVRGVSQRLGLVAGHGQDSMIDMCVEDLERAVRMVVHVQEMIVAENADLDLTRAGRERYKLAHGGDGGGSRE